MSWEHGTYGWGEYEGFVSALKIAGIRYAEEQKSEVYSRGQDMNCNCYCSYMLETELGKTVKECVNYSDERFESFIRLLHRANPKEYDVETALEWRRQLRDDGGISCPCCKETCGHTQHLRIARFENDRHEKMVAEEYLAVKDCDCDGASQVAIAVYKEGERPDLVTQLLEA